MPTNRELIQQKIEKRKEQLRNAQQEIPVHADEPIGSVKIFDGVKKSNPIKLAN